MTKLSRPWPIVIIGTTIIVSLFTYIFPDSALRPFLIFWFLLICPGMAWVRLIRLDGTIVELSLALGLSISIDSLVTFAFLYSNAWSPEGIFVTLLIISFVGAVVQLVSRSSLFSAFYRRTNVKQEPTASLASVSSFTQQRTDLHLAEMQTQHMPALAQALLSKQQGDLHFAEMQTQSVPVSSPSRPTNTGEDQPIEKLDTVRMPALPTTPQGASPHLAEMQTQSVPTPPTTQHKEDAHLDEIHTQMLPVPIPPSKRPRKGLMSFAPSTPTLSSVPPTPRFPAVPPTPTLPSVPPTPRFPAVPPTPTLSPDEPTPEKPARTDIPIRDKNKNTVADPFTSAVHENATETPFFELMDALLTPQDKNREKLVPNEQPSPIPAAAPKQRNAEDAAQAPRTPHPRLVEQDENKQKLDAFVDDEDDDTAKTPSVIVTPKSEKKEK